MAIVCPLLRSNLHIHCVQVQVYARDVSSTMKEPVGYVILDLRSAQNKPVSLGCLFQKYLKNFSIVNANTFHLKSSNANATTFQKYLKCICI